MRRRRLTEHASALGWALLPGECVLCALPSGRNRDLCAACEASLDQVPSPCPRCGLLDQPGIGAATRATVGCRHCSGTTALGEPWPVRTVLAPLVYRGATQRLIHRFKHRRELAAGRELLATVLAANAGWAAAQTAARAILVPMPQSRWRTLERGFDPVRWLARTAGRRLDLRVIPDLLSRRHRRAQQSLDLAARLRGPAGAFRLSDRAWQRVDLPGPETPLILVDDVITTGATLAAAAAPLRARGHDNLHALALARTL